VLTESYRPARHDAQYLIRRLLRQKSSVTPSLAYPRRPRHRQTRRLHPLDLPPLESILDRPPPPREDSFPEPSTPSLLRRIPRLILDARNRPGQIPTPRIQSRFACQGHLFRNRNRTA
jgi:hypothetical protein